MDTNLLQNSQALLATVLSFGGAYGIYAVKNIFNYFLTKTTVIKDTEARNITDNALSILDTLLETSITYTENTLKPSVIQAISDGKVTKDELKSLGNIVKTNVLSQLTDDSKIALSKIAINVEDFVEKRLETVLGNLKVDDSSSVSKTTVQEPEKPIVDTTELENQLTQANADKDGLIQQNQQLQQAQNELTNTNTQLIQTVADVQAENENLKAQLSNIQNAINNATVTSNASATPIQEQVVDNQAVTQQ